MPEQDNDRLEQFFRKVASRSDVSFNEDDWKKLESRLDAADALKAGAKKAGTRITTAVVVGVVILFSSVWFSMQYGLVQSGDNTASVRKEQVEKANDNPRRDEVVSSVSEDPGNTTDNPAGATPVKREDDGQETEVSIEQAYTKRDLTELTTDPDKKPGNNTPAIPESKRLPEPEETSAAVSIKNESIQPYIAQADLSGGEEEKIPSGDVNEDPFPATPPLESRPQVLTSSPGDGERDKQKAVVVLPGAEEEDIREVEAMVQEEHASDNKKHVVTPRLSLLLFFAPDFSGTRIGQYSAPGKAYGALIHYHLFNRWSISGGVIKNLKEYTSAGEDYDPPKNYWEYYTNGVIPETIDGSCSILEFPLMVQYTVVNSGKNKLNVGAGLSSYLMQTESYRYHFGQPNPGAKNGWDSRGSSQFFFNMLNFSIGYERQLLPGVMFGIEPYAKFPLENIGWSNIRLFSTGASFTVRYTIVRSGTLSVPTRSRGPD